MSNWKDIIGPLKKTDAFIHAYNYQKLQRQKGINVFPPQKDLFNAFSYTPFSKLKVALLSLLLVKVAFTLKVILHL